MNDIERRVERAIREGEEVLRGELGDPPNEEAWADLADQVIGDLADDYQEAVAENERLRKVMANAKQMLADGDEPDDVRVVLALALDRVGGQ